jgi:hypothetical protein
MPIEPARAFAARCTPLSRRKKIENGEFIMLAGIVRTKLQSTRLIAGLLIALVSGGATAAITVNSTSDMAANDG